MNLDEALAWISDDAAEMVALLREASPAQPVPACPGWTAADLSSHVARGFAAWYCYNISTPADAWDPAGLMARFASLGDDHGANVDAFEVGVNEFIGLGTELDLSATTWAFGGTAPAEWWVRRAASELTVHLTDAAGIHGRRSSTTPERHTDAIDEAMTEVYPRIGALRSTMNALLGDNRPVPATPERPAMLATADTGAVWSLSRTDDGTPHATRGPIDGPEAVGRGSSADLVAWLFGRPMPSPLTIEGDASLLDEWNLFQRSSF